MSFEGTEDFPGNMEVVEGWCSAMVQWWFARKLIGVETFWKLEEQVKGKMEKWRQFLDPPMYIALFSCPGRVENGPDQPL